MGSRLINIHTKFVQTLDYKLSIASSVKLLLTLLATWVGSNGLRILSDSLLILPLNKADIGNKSLEAVLEAVVGPPYPEFPVYAEDESLEAVAEPPYPRISSMMSCINVLLASYVHKFE